MTKYGLAYRTVSILRATISNIVINNMLIFAVYLVYFVVFIAIFAD